MSIEQPTPEQSSELEVFQEEIEALKQVEITEGKTAHLRESETYPIELNPDELIDEDRTVWEKLQERKLSRNEFEEYRFQIVEEGNENRNRFAAFIANLLTSQMLEKDIKKLAQD